VFTNQGVVPYFIIIPVFTQVVSVTDPVLLGSVSLGILGFRGRGVYKGKYLSPSPLRGGRKYQLMSLRKKNYEKGEEKILCKKEKRRKT
jgi:hypothetical protein